MAIAANHMNGFDKANRQCQDPWFQDVSRCVPGKIYYQRFFGHAPHEEPRIVKYIGPNIDPENPHLVHNFVFHPEVIIGGQPVGLGTPEVLNNSCLREVPGQAGIGAQPMVLENNQAGGKWRRRTNRKRKNCKGKRKTIVRRRR